jgi:alpha-tubulin suppressor-like RCC1 family protein
MLYIYFVSKGQLGIGAQITSQNEPIPVDNTGVLFNKTIVDVSTGENHSLLLSSDGLLFACGYNK